MHVKTAPPSHHFLQGGGEVGALIRAFDWSANGLGDPAGWPQPLKTLMDVMLGSAQPMFIAWGPDRILIYNDRYAPILGQRHPQALGQPFFAVWSEIEAEVRPIMERTFAGESVHMDDITLMMTRHGHPEEAHFSFSYTPVRNEQGTVTGMFCACAEITEQVKVLASVKDQKDRLQELFKQAPGFMCVLRGPEHIFEIVNNSYLQLIGHRRDILGKPARDALPEVEGQGFFRLLDKVFSTGQPFTGRNMRVALQREPGDPVEERFVDLVYQPITDTDGTVTGIFAEGYDVTERVLAEQALREREARHRQILNSATDYAIIAMDMDGRVTSWNAGAERVLGWSEDEMLGQPLDNFFTSEDVAARQPLKEMQIALSKGFALDERWHQHKNGKRFWASGELTPLKDDIGTITGFVKVMRDRTEQRRAQEHQNILIDELNHRVKNTLATVQSLATQTFKGKHQEDAARLTFEGRLFALAAAHDVLTREHWEGANLKEIVAEALAPYTQSGKQRFDIRGPDLRLPPAMALAIAMALHELATNAAKYGALSLASGRVRIEWTVSDAKSFTLKWIEEHGPKVTAPTRRGFGTRLIERSLAQELGGAVHLTYDPTGVVCVVEAPLAEPIPPEDRNEHP